MKDFAKFRNQFQEEVDSLKERIAKLNVQVSLFPIFLIRLDSRTPLLKVEDETRQFR